MTRCRRPSGIRLFGIPALVLALAFQLALVFVDLPDRPAVADASTLASVSVLCLSSTPAGAPAHGHTHPAAGTVAVWAAAEAGILPAGPPSLPSPVLLPAWRAHAPPPRAPPAGAPAAAYPRGPPALV